MAYLVIITHLLQISLADQPPNYGFLPIVHIQVKMTCPLFGNEAHIENNGRFDTLTWSNSSYSGQNDMSAFWKLSTY